MCFSHTFVTGSDGSRHMFRDVYQWKGRTVGSVTLEGFSDSGGKRCLALEKGEAEVGR